MQKSTTCKFSLSREKGWIILLAILATSITALLYHFVFLRVPTTTDETSYVFQAYVFLEGKIARPMPPLTDAFAQEMLIMDERVGWMSRYPPGHTFWLIPGCAIGWPHLMVALAAGLSLWLIAGTARLFDARASLVAAGMLLISPFFLFTYGTLLSHTSGLLATTLLLYGFFRWQREGPARFAVLAAAGWGWLFLNRSYTSIWLVLPLGLYALIQLRRHWHERTYWLGLLCFAGVAIGFVLALMAYNYCALGDPFMSTYLFYDPSETPGFGLKHARNAPILHTPVMGLENLLQNIRLYDLWLFGFRGSLVMVILLAWVLWPTAACGLMFSSALLVWTAYIFFYYPGVNITGPSYYFETLPLLIIPSAVGFVRLIDRLPTHAWRRTALIVTCAAVLGMSVHFMARQARVLHGKFQGINNYLEVFRRAPDQALIIVDGLVPFSGSRSVLFLNRHGLKSRPLVVRSMGKLNKVLIKHFPDRTPYYLYGTDKPQIMPLPLATLSYEQESQPSALHGLTGSLVKDHVQRMGIRREADATRDAAGWLAFGVQWPVFPGSFEVLFELETCTDSSEPVVTLDVACDGGRHIIAERVVQGSFTNVWQTLTFSVNKLMVVEPRVYFLGRGIARVARIRLRELPPSIMDQNGNTGSTPNVTSGTK